MQKVEVSKRSRNKQPQSILILQHQNLFLETPVASQRDARGKIENVAFSEQIVPLIKVLSK